MQAAIRHFTMAMAQIETTQSADIMPLKLGLPIAERDFATTLHWLPLG